MTKLINCKNCGAPLKSSKCEYCGSEYQFIPEINSFEQIIELYVAGRKRKFYIGSIGYEPLTTSYRNITGDMFCVKHGEEIKLELISYD